MNRQQKENTLYIVMRKQQKLYFNWILIITDEIFSGETVQKWSIGILSEQGIYILMPLLLHTCEPIYFFLSLYIIVVGMELFIYLFLLIKKIQLQTLINLNYVFIKTA